MSPPSSICRSRPILKYLNPTVTTRCASNSTRSAAEKATTIQSVKVPPEHPKFIHVPQPLQKQSHIPALQKGVLPKPRIIFNSTRLNKVSPSYLAAVTPEPTNKPVTDHLPEEQKEYINYKARQSQQRRQNLREGLTQLHARKLVRDARVKNISRQKQIDHHRRVTAPERPDEFLSRASVLDSLSGKQHVKVDPNIEQILEKKKHRHARVTAGKMAERQDALHTLYMNAGDFIVTENKLIEKIEEEFENQIYIKNPGRGIWDHEGIPETTQWMLHERGQSGSAISNNKHNSLLEAERVRRLMEELTGGKIERPQDPEA